MHDDSAALNREELAATRLEIEKRELEALGEENARLNAAIDAEKAKKKDTRDVNGVSRYGRKKAYCAANGVWGWEVPEPKPWK